MDIQNERLWSLDALRGFDMLFISGLSAVIVKLCALCGAPDAWLVHQMQHVPWDGFAHHDTIFPLFLFIAGATFPFSLAKQREKGYSTTRIWLRTLKRGLVLFLLGLVVNGLLRFEWGHLRVFSVLGRIGLAWMFASWIWMFLRTRTRVAVALGLLLGYWALTALCVAPDHPDASPFTREGNICCWFDRTFFTNHIYQKLYDPEGALSVLPAIVTALLGMFTGWFAQMRRDGLTGGRKVAILAGAAALLGVAAVVWGRWYPINKALWSSTFVCAAGAYSVAMFALFYGIIDVLGWRRWTLYFRVVGLNSITIYLAQQIIGFNQANNYLFGGLAKLFPDKVGALVVSLGYMAVVWLFLYFLHRQKVYLKV